MSVPDLTVQPTLGIGAVERETGFSKDILRVWERRYNFPHPERDKSGERAYPMEQVEKLRLIKRLLDQGHRPAKVIHFGLGELGRMAGQPKGGSSRDDASETREDLLRYIALCKAHQFEEMRRQLSQDIMRLGMVRFAIDVIAPLTTLVGMQWANGYLAVFEEHVYTETVQGIMRNAIAAIPRTVSSEPGPRVLLATFPQEQHGLGLLMAEAILALEGAQCISLGVSAPLTEIAQAANTQDADILALSFSAAMNANHVLRGLLDLRSGLSRHVEIWAGGRCAVLYRSPPPAVRVLELHEIHDALADWRIRHRADSKAAAMP